MARTSYLGEILGSLLDQPRRLLRGPKNGTIQQLCQALLKERAEASSLQIAAEILARFAAMDADAIAAFFDFINNELDIEPAAVAEAAHAYAKDGSPQSYDAMMRAAEPRRHELLRRLNQPPGATGELVRMRKALLAEMRQNPDLARTDRDFALMLRAWFNRGFLVLRQITWDSPASVLEKIIAYEAVHEIETWDDLRRRLHPADRRCFAFFHPAMPDEPLIFVEIALSKGIPISIQEVLADRREILDEEAADTAVFYSISNCQQGLAGISFGNSLIKQVARDLAIELPGVSSFVTLSPIPGLKHWLENNQLDTSADDPATMQKLAAFYLAREKNQAGQPLDPVARFHLSNGAQILAVQADADLSQTGISQSLGVMVNYAYELDKITANLEQLARTGQVATSNSIRTFARQGQKLVTP